MKLPKWARKPNHKLNVIPSIHGWIVEKTGEILVSCYNLPEKLNTLNINDFEDDTINNDIKSTPLPPIKKKRGRPKKINPNSTTQGNENG
jgi:hypothetical protein